MITGNTWVFWTELEVEAARKALAEEFKAGRLRQGWGPPGTSVLENGRIASEASWTARYSASIRKNWPATFSEDRKLLEPSSIASRYRILVRMVQVKANDLVVVPRLCKPGGFSITIATAGYTFANFSDPATGRSDFGHLLNVDPSRVDFADDESDETEQVARSFRFYRTAITRVADRSYSSLVRSLYESRKGSTIGQSSRRFEQENQPPETRLERQLRFDRDSELVRQLKEQYQWSCQICQESVPRSTDKPPYVEVHHIRPLGRPFNGSDVAGNMLVVCPNCHAALDLGSYGIDPLTHLVHTIDGFTRIQPLSINHDIAPENLDFQWERFNQIRKASC
jgi:hypothetical protein